MLADALLAAATERAFADTGHSLDFINKAFECLELIGWEHAAAVLPTVVGQMVAARGAEESTAWRQPDDLVALCDNAVTELPGLFAAARSVHGWSEHTALAQKLLGDDPVAIIEALTSGLIRRATDGMPEHAVQIEEVKTTGSDKQLPFRLGRSAAMHESDGFPQALAVVLGLAIAFALALFALYAFSNALDGYSATGTISRSGAVTSLVMALAATIERCCA
jgi:hypothetical protein